MLARHLKNHLNKQASLATALESMSKELIELVHATPTPATAERMAQIAEAQMYLTQQLRTEQHHLHEAHVCISDKLDELKIEICIKGINHAQHLL
jgi:hypothetical protein